MNNKLDGTDWYAMYKKCNILKGDKDNVTTSIIWGCLWDATLEWFVKSSAQNSLGTPITYSLIGDDSISWGNYPESVFNYIPVTNQIPTEINRKTESANNIIIPTGSSNYTKVNNIYDMAGNQYEMTLETQTSTAVDNRGLRGANRGVGVRSYYSVTKTEKNYNGCRAILLIK